MISWIVSIECCFRYAVVDSPPDSVTCLCSSPSVDHIGFGYPVCSRPNVVSVIFAYVLLHRFVWGSDQYIFGGQTHVFDSHLEVSFDVQPA